MINKRNKNNIKKTKYIITDDISRNKQGKINL